MGSKSYIFFAMSHQSFSFVDVMEQAKTSLTFAELGKAKDSQRIELEQSSHRNRTGGHRSGGSVGQDRSSSSGGRSWRWWSWMQFDFFIKSMLLRRQLLFFIN